MLSRRRDLIPSTPVGIVFYTKLINIINLPLILPNFVVIGSFAVVVRR